MPVILLAHRDSQVRASLGAALTARGFDVIGIDSIDTALDAAAAGASALLCELQLLADEDLEVKTRLDLRSGRPTRILALTHKASVQEMSMLKRHGAGLLSRSVEDIDRMAAMLRIPEDAPAPWEGSGPKPPPPAAPKAQPSNIVPPPAPRPPPPAMSSPPDTSEPKVAAPWDDSNAIGLDSSPPPVSPTAPTFKPAPAMFTPPDLSKSIAAAAAAPKSDAPKPQPLPPPPQFVPPPAVAAPPAPVAVPFDDAKTAIGAPFPAPPSDDGPLQVPSDLFETPDIPSGAPSASAPPKAFTWNDDTESEIRKPAPAFDTNAFRDEVEVPTTNVKAAGGGTPPSDTISRAIAETAVSVPKPPPKVEVEAVPDSTGTFDTAAPDVSKISATVSNAWFDDSAVNGVDKSTPGTGPVVLVVEDEPAFRSFLKEALGGQGYRVHTAINGPNALRFVKQNPAVDLVISDLHMPHMDGFELKHEMDQFLGRSIPFILCTADADDEKIQVAAKVGAAALVPKPIENLEAFFAIITDTLMDAGVIARTA